MARLVLHIGTHKTGDAELQARLAAHAAALAAEGVVWPGAGSAPGHHGLAADWNPDLGAWAPPEGARAALRRLARDHAGSDRTVLISSAEFSRGRAGARVDFGELRADLAGFERIEVICVLRDQWRFIEAVWAEVNRSRRAKPPGAFLEDALRHGAVAGLWTDYTRLCRHLLTAFAPGEIAFLDHRACREAPGGVTGAILSRLGVAQGGPAWTAATAEGGAGPPDPMSAPLAVFAAAQAADPDPVTPWLAAAAAGALGAHYGAGREATLWTRAQLAEAQAYGQRANARLADLLPGFRLAPEPPGPDLLHPEDLDRAWWMRLNRWLFAVTQGPPAA